MGGGIGGGADTRGGRWVDTPCGDIERVAGIGPSRAAKLRAAGVHTAAALGALGADEVAALAVRLGLPLRPLRASVESARAVTRAGAASGEGARPEREV